MPQPRSLLRPSYLRGLFLSTALMLGGAASSQSPHQATYGAPEHNFEHQKLNPVSRRTGILYLYGQELEKKNIPLAQERIKHARKTFRDMPFEMVGDAKHPISIPDIAAAMDRLGAHGLDDLILINLFHGQVKTAHDADNHFHQDNLLLSRNDKNNLHADSLYRAIGNQFEQNRALRNTRLTVLHVSCYGETALAAFHHLPANTAAITLSNATTPTLIPDYGDLFARAFEDLHKRSTMQMDPMFKMDQRRAIAAGIFMTGSFHPNKFNETAITFVTDSVTADQKFAHAPHGAYVVKPMDVMDAFLNNYVENDVIPILAKNFDLLDMEDGLHAIKRAHIFRDNPMNDASAQRDMGALVVALVAMETHDPRLNRPSIESAAKWGVIGVEKPVSTPTPRP